MTGDSEWATGSPMSTNSGFMTCSRWPACTHGPAIEYAQDMHATGRNPAAERRARHPCRSGAPSTSVYDWSPIATARSQGTPRAAHAHVAACEGLHRIAHEVDVEHSRRLDGALTRAVRDERNGKPGIL